MKNKEKIKKKRGVKSKMVKIAPKKDIRRAYSDLAWTESILSPPEESVKDTEVFSKVIKEHSRIEVKTLLHIGCGAGRYDYTFKKHFKVTGVDLSFEMLKLARELSPEVKYCYGDMRTVRLGECFDAVTIPDSIAYMRTVEDLRRAFITAYQHLKPGGVFLACIEEPEIKERFKPINIIYTASQGDVEITLFENYYDPDPTDTSFEATHIYLIRRKGKLEIHSDHHLIGTFPLETWHNLLKEVGFEVNPVRKGGALNPVRDLSLNGVTPPATISEKGSGLCSSLPKGAGLSNGVKEVKTIKTGYSLVTEGEYPPIEMLVCIKP